MTEKERALSSLERGIQYPYVEDPSAVDSSARRTVLGILADLTDRRGVRQELENIDDDVRLELVNSLVNIVEVEMGLGEGPVNVGVAREINRLHATDRNWELAFDTKEQKFTTVVGSITGGIEHVKSDSLYEAIRVALFESERSK